MLSIIDYGVGNLASIQNMLKKIGCESIISSNASEISAADKLILPGVGAFDTCARQLQLSGLLPVIEKKVMEEKTPVLGVCVGMQLLFERSEEGELAGLGWIKGTIVKFDQTKLSGNQKVPHMGWSDTKLLKPSKLIEGMEEPRFYFVHSYHAQVKESIHALLSTHYGYDFVSGVEKGNILGVQFHPEKSHVFGMKLLENFVKNY